MKIFNAKIVVTLQINKRIKMERNKNRDFKKSRNTDNKRDNKFSKKPFIKNEDKRLGSKKIDYKGISSSGENKFKIKLKDKSEHLKISKPHTDSKDNKEAYRKFEPKVYEKLNLPKRNRPQRTPVLALKDFKDSNREDFSKPVRLNKYIANSGICSRREADQLITSGAISINGIIVTELGIKVNPGDTVQYGGETLVNEKKRYILLNKPKGYITTTDDPQERRTVMALVKDACRERIYPVGRLDRNTTGLLLFTNDGELAKKLTHPKHGAQKIYHVELDKPLSKADMEAIANGIELDDGIAEVDEIAYIEQSKTKKEIGIEIHSGRNRIIRRIFEKLGYEVVKLDRVMFAGLTKKNISRGMWRFLDEKEIVTLKMLK